MPPTTASPGCSLGTFAASAPFATRRSDAWRDHLIAGKNNSGKTALLEALKLYAGNASPVVLRAWLKALQEAGKPVTD